MPSYIPQRPVPSLLRSRQTGAAVSSAHGRRWAQSALHLRGWAVEPIAAHSYHPHKTNGACDYWIIYRRTPGVEVVRVVVRLHSNVGGTTNRSCTLSLAYGSAVAGVGAVTFAGDTPYFFDGSTAVPIPYSAGRQSPELTAYLDATKFSDSALNVIRLRYTPTTNDGWNGVRSFSLQECPRSTSDLVADPTGEPGIDEAEPDVRNRIRAGTTGTNGGLVRLASEIDVYRISHRRHLQINCPSSATYENLAPYSTFGGAATYWTANSTTEAALNYRAPIGLDIKLRSRPCKLYQSTPGNNYRFAAIYAFDPAWSDFTNSYLRVRSDSSGVGGAGTTNTNLPLTNTGGLTTFVLGSVGSHGQRIDGSSPIAPIEETSFAAITADNPVTTSSEVRVLAFALIEEET